MSICKCPCGQNLHRCKSVVYKYLQRRFVQIDFMVFSLSLLIFVYANLIK